MRTISVTVTTPWIAFRQWRILLSELRSHRRLARCRHKLPVHGWLSRCTNEWQARPIGLRSVRITGAQSK